MNARALLLVFVLFAGCAAPAIEPSAAPADPNAPGAYFGADAGRIEGHVVDDSLVPVHNATVLLVELEWTNQTTAAGEFAFPNLAPGTYTLIATGDNYTQAEQVAYVNAGEATSPSLILTRLPARLAYHATKVLAFLYCNISGVLISINGCVPSTGPSTANLSFPLDWAQTLTEMTWRPTGLATGQDMGMSLYWLDSSTGINVAMTYNRTAGTAPLRIELLPDTSYLPPSVLGPQGKTPPAGQTGPLLLSIEKPSLKAAGQSTGIAFVWQQRVDVFHTVFYYAPNADIQGFTMLPDS